MRLLHAFEERNLPFLPFSLPFQSFHSWNWGTLHADEQKKEEECTVYVHGENKEGGKEWLSDKAVMEVIWTTTTDLQVNTVGI